MTILVYIILIIYFLITGYLFYKLYILKGNQNESFIPKSVFTVF